MMSHRDSQSSGFRTDIAWLAFAASTIVLCAYALSFALNHDVAWWLFAAESMLEGESLYRDLIEINPPLYGYLSVIPVAIGRVIGFEAFEIVELYYLFVFVLLAAWSTSLLRLDLRDRYGGPLAAAFLVLILIGLPGVDLAQREHVMLALFLPYLLTQTGRRLGSEVSFPLAIAVGVAGGFGIALKPHFVLTWVLVELALWLRTPRKKRWLLRPELWSSAIILAGYGAFVFLAYPAYVQLLIDARHLYTDFSSKPLSTLLLRPSALMLVATTAFFWFGGNRDRCRRQYAGDLLVLAWAAWLVALLQAKGWAYHFYPTLAATTLAAMLLIFDQMVRLKKGDNEWPKASRVGTVLFGGLVVAVLTLTIGGQIAYDGARSAVLEAQLEYLHQESPQALLIMSPRVPDSFPVVNRLGVEWASPFPHLWWLQAAHGDEPGSKAAPPVPKDSVELGFRDRLIERMISVEPDLVLVDTAQTPRFSEAAFPYVAYMRQDGRFQRLWEGYERTGAVLHFQIYSRYKGRE